MIYLPLGFAVKDLDNVEEENNQKFDLIQGNPYNFSHLTQYLNSLKDSKKAIV